MNTMTPKQAAQAKLETAIRFARLNQSQLGANNPTTIASKREVSKARAVFRKHISKP